ncbi:MAG: hypothetical protein C0501_22010 [Isosphaera sp.]|nr:hypothetical protein [Isosphaera sp.]
MSYQQVWTRGASDAMGAAVRNYPAHKDTFAAALRELSDRLGTDPGDFGESREGNDRVGFVGPFAVHVRVLHADRQVVILAVHLVSFLP